MIWLMDMTHLIKPEAAKTTSNQNCAQQRAENNPGVLTVPYINTNNIVMTPAERWVSDIDKRVICSTGLGWIQCL
jgi:hypothetical protein